MQYIIDLKHHEGQSIHLKGWVANKRTGKGLVFLVLRDGSGYCQCVVDEAIVGTEIFEAAKSLTQESSVEVIGNVVKDDRQMGGYEIQASNVLPIQIAEDFPISNKEHGVDFLMDKRHLWLRSRRQWAAMRVRNAVIFAIHEFFQNRGFVQMDAPLFTGNACEGTTTLFETDFYGEPAYLSQSGQLYGEAMAMAQGRIYTFGPTFRAEKSKTRRHLSEFWMIEPEMAYYTNEMNMDLLEEFLSEVVGKVLDKCVHELEVLDRDVTKLQTVKAPFPRLSYDDAVKILKGEQAVDGRYSIQVLEEDLQKAEATLAEMNESIANYEAELATPGLKKGKRNYFQSQIDKLKNQLKDIQESIQNIPQWIASAKNFTHGEDFGGSDETVLTRLYDCPIMVYNWPAPIKAFYMKEVDGDPRYVKGVDVLAPEGFGEIVGGAERETDIEVLKRKIVEHDLPMEAFEWYLDLRRYGSVPHSGFGLGLERLVAWICNLSHVRETIPFPRMYGRLLP